MHNRAIKPNSDQSTFLGIRLWRIPIPNGVGIPHKLEPATAWASDVWDGPVRVACLFISRFLAVAHANRRDKFHL